MQKQIGIQAPTLGGGLADLESFRAWAEEIKTNMSQADPSLYEVLGEISFSKQPIKEGGYHPNFSKDQEGGGRNTSSASSKERRSKLRRRKRLIKVLMSTGQQKHANFREEMKADSLGVS